MAGIELGIDGLEDCRVIGSGGFATVYSAHDVRFGRTVAVKILSNVDEDGRRRFDREQLSMGKLSNHPHVVTAFSSGYTTGGQPYLIMEYLAGGSLADLVDRGERLPWEKAVRHITSIAKALEHAHSHGVLHRDVKPENILLGSDGTAKLTDFGISSVREGVATQAVGFSLAHAPPETFVGGVDNRDERSDLYSLASSLITVVDGRAPYESPDGDNSQLAYIVRISDNPVPRLGIPRFDQFLNTAMAKNPASRYQTAAEFIDGLASTLSPPDQQPFAPREANTTVADAGHPDPLPSSKTAVYNDDGSETSQTTNESVPGDTTDQAELQPATGLDIPDPVESQAPVGSEVPNVVEVEAAGRPDPLAADEAATGTELPTPIEGQTATASGTQNAIEDQPDVGFEAPLDDLGQHHPAGKRPRSPNESPTHFATLSEGGDGTADRRQEGLFERATTVVAERPDQLGNDRAGGEKLVKKRQTGVMIAAALGLVAIGLFLAYLLRPGPQQIQTGDGDATTTESEDSSPSEDGDIESELDNESDSVSDESTSDTDSTDGAAGVVGGSHTETVNGLANLTDGRFVSFSEDGTVLVWDPNDQESEPTGFEIGGDLTVTHSLALTNGKVVSRRSDDAAIIWDPDDLAGAPTIFDGRASDGGFVEMENGWIASVDPSDKGLILWDPNNDDDVTVIEGDSSVETFEPLVQLTSLGDTVVTASKDHTLSLWTIDAAAGAGSLVPGALVGSHSDTINDVLVLTDGTVASASDDGTIMLQVPGGSDDEVFVFDEHPRDAFDIVQFDDGRIATGGVGTSIVWNPADPKWVQDEEKTGLISRLTRATDQAIMSDGRLAIVNRKEVVVWNPNLPSPSPIVSKSAGSRTHDENVTALIALADGRLASADEGGTVAIWDPDDNS